MKVLIVREANGNVQSVAVPNPAVAADLHLEVEGGTVRVVELDSSAIRGDDLTGKNGLKAQRKAHAALDALMRKS
jgi:hypothetical protein